IALKAAEGTARQMSTLLKQELGRTLATKLGYLLARRAFRAVSDKLDPRKSNGGVFLGLNGIVIKSHGGIDAEGFAYAIARGRDLVQHALLASIGETLTRHHRETAPPRAAHSASSDARNRADASEASGQRGNSTTRAHGASADARDRAGDTRPEPGSSARAV